MPLISVIIPIYKVEQYLKRCVDSVLAQTFKDYQVILVDDGSPDNCPTLCDDYAAANANVCVVHKVNGGLSDARNAGLKVAEGKYVMFLDGDDYLDENCFSALVKSNTHDADLVIGSIVYAYEGTDNKVFQEKTEDFLLVKKDFPERLPKLLDQRRLNYVHAKLYKKQVIDKNGLTFQDEKLTSAEDTVFNFSFLKVCQSIALCGEYVHFYMQHMGLASKFVEDRYVRFSRLSGFLEETCKQMGVYNQSMQAVINKRRVLSAIWCKDGILKADIDYDKKAALLNDIRSDKTLKKIIADTNVDGSKDIEKLIAVGGGKYLNFCEKRQKKLNRKAKILSLCPKFIKSLYRKLKGGK